MSIAVIKQSNTFNFNQSKYSEIYKQKSCDVELPYVEYDHAEGERLLVVLTYATDDDLKSRRLGKSSQGLLVKNLVEKINSQDIDKNLPKIKEVSLINYKDFHNDRSFDFDKSIEGDFHKWWVDRLVDYINVYKPTRILLSGDLPYRSILKHSQPLNEKDQLKFKEPFLEIGRVFNFKYGELIVPTSFTLPFHWTSTSNPKYIESAPHLIQQQKYHLEMLLYGKSIYTITDSKTWKRVDIMNLEVFDNFYEKLLANKITCIDIETNNLSRFANQILTLHFSLDGQTAYNLPLCHKDTPFDGEEIRYIQSKLKNYFEKGKSDYLVFHNAKFDIGVMTAQLGLEYFNHRIADVIANIFSLDENTRYYTALQVSTYNLRHVAFQYGCPAYEEGEIGKADRANMAEIPLDHIFEYAAKDVIIPYQVCQFQFLEAERRSYHKWKEFVIDQLGAMVLVFVGMENKGILVDRNYLINLCSNDGIVRKLLDEILDKFKTSAKARQVNEILVIQERVVNDLHRFKSSFKSLKRKLASKVKESQKPFKVSRTLKATPELIPALEAQHSANAKKVTETVEFITPTLDHLIYVLNEGETVFNKDPALLKKYGAFVEEGKLEVELIALKNSLLEIRDDVVEPFYNLINEVLLKSLSISSYRKEPVDHDKQWLFNVAKRSSQQLLFFEILGLKSLENRKDGGGKTNKEFQAKYGEVEEVVMYDNYTKYMKLMSTYITGMMKQLEEDPDARLDGRIRSDYGYRDVLTGRCLRGDVLIETDLGPIAIETLVKNRTNCKVLTHTGEWQEVTDWLHSGDREVFEVVLESGKVVHTTKCHPFLTEEGWRPLHTLDVGASVIVRE